MNRLEGLTGRVLWSSGQRGTSNITGLVVQAFVLAKLVELHPEALESLSYRGIQELRIPRHGGPSQQQVPREGPRDSAPRAEPRIIPEDGREPLGPPGAGAGRELVPLPGGGPPPTERPTGTLPTPERPMGSPSAPLISRGTESSSLPALLGTSSPPPQNTGFSKEQTTLIYQQVMVASQLFSVEGSQQGATTSSSTSQLFLFVQQFQSLSQNCAQLDVQMKQLTEHGKGLSPEDAKKLGVTLHALLKQFETLQKQTREAFPQSLPSEKNARMPEDLQKAISVLKARCDLGCSQLQSQLQEKLVKLAGEINLKYTNAGVLSDKGAGLKSPQESPVGSGRSVSPTGPQVEKGGRPTVAPTPSTSISESAVQAGLEPKVASKPSSQLPQLVQSSMDLQSLGDKLQRKELTIPLNISLMYPFDKKEQTQVIGGTKTDAKQGKRDQTAEFQGSGGGHEQEMVLIPSGPVIFEGPFLKEGVIHAQIIELDAYLIAAFPVTNEQYADWLNEEMQAQKIKVDERGVIRDQHHNVLYLTHRAASTSQIDIEVVNEQIVFNPLKGTQRHPVVQVSWFGAEAYCNGNHFRLPTEAEWEKAAGMAITREGEPLLKFRFGCGEDDIDLSWANYRDELREYDDNRTFPVGFYNGNTVFTKGGRDYQSHYACSPYGCYDMSGNVRQWTAAGGPEGKKVAKGGSYNSPLSELHVSARSLFLPESCQSDTGFRVVFDIL